MANIIAWLQNTSQGRKNDRETGEGRKDGGRDVGVEIGREWEMGREMWGRNRQGERGGERNGEGERLGGGGGNNTLQRDQYGRCHGRGNSEPVSMPTQTGCHIWMHMSKNGLQNVKWLSEEEEEEKKTELLIFITSERERGNTSFSSPFGLIATAMSRWFAWCWKWGGKAGVNNAKSSLEASYEYACASITGYKCRPITNFSWI